jgi:hypothetical protein
VLPDVVLLDISPAIGFLVEISDEDFRAREIWG